MPFDFRRLDIPEVVLIEPNILSDERGFFMETYKRSDFEVFGINEEFVQDNHSRSAKGVLRGLHYQLKPGAQGKLLRCTLGSVFDVAVDIREGSPTFAKWVGIELSDENKRMLYIPPGFAHGFLSLTDLSEVIYKCTAEYSSEDERGIAWNDPDIAIDWPLKEPVLSARDSGLPLLKDADNNFVYEPAA